MKASKILLLIALGLSAALGSAWVTTLLRTAPQTQIAPIELPEREVTADRSQGEQEDRPRRANADQQPREPETTSQDVGAQPAPAPAPAPAGSEVDDDGDDDADDESDDGDDGDD